MPTAPEYPWTYGRNAHLFEIDEPRALKLVEMHPTDFLELAAPMTFDREVSGRIVEAISSGGPMELPWLELTVLEDRTCRITGHEGRHRVEASRLLGMERVPVLIYLRERVRDDEGRYHYPFLEWSYDPCCHHVTGKGSGREYLVCHATEQTGDMTLGKDGWVGPAKPEDLDVFLLEREIDWRKTPLAKSPPHWRREHGLE